MSHPSRSNPLLCSLAIEFILYGDPEEHVESLATVSIVKPAPALGLFLIRMVPVTSSRASIPNYEKKTSVLMYRLVHLFSLFNINTWCF